MWLRTVEDGTGVRTTGVGSRPFVEILARMAQTHGLHPEEKLVLIFERKLTEDEVRSVNELGDRGITLNG